MGMGCHGTSGCKKTLVVHHVKAVNIPDGRRSRGVVAVGGPPEGQRDPMGKGHRDTPHCKQTLVGRSRKVGYIPDGRMLWGEPAAEGPPLDRSSFAQQWGGCRNQCPPLVPRHNQERKTPPGGRTLPGWPVVGEPSRSPWVRCVARR